VHSPDEEVRAPPADAVKVTVPNESRRTVDHAVHLVIPEPPLQERLGPWRAWWRRVPAFTTHTRPRRATARTPLFHALL